MKKLLSVLLCALMVAMLVPSAMAAEFPEKDFDFSESSTASDYGVLNNITTSTISVDATGGIDGGAALKLNFGGSNANINFLDPAKDGATPSAVEVKFNFKFSVDNVRMKFVLNKSDKSVDDSEVLYVKNNTGVKFLGQTVIAAYKLSKDTWYDVEMLIDIAQGYGRLKLKKNADSAWQVFHVLGAETAVASGGLKDMTCTKRLGIGVMDSAGAVYIDNYIQKLATNVKPALLDADDFSGGIGTWKTANTDAEGKTGVSVAVEGGKLSITHDGTATGTANSGVYKDIPANAIVGAPENAIYTFKFKFGQSANTKNYTGATITTATPYSGQTGSPETWLVTIIDGKLNMFMTYDKGSGTDTNQNFGTAFGNFEDNVLYDAEVVYNPTNGKIRVTATNATGKQVSGIMELPGGAATRFAFRNASKKASGATNVDASTAYFDDFESGVLKAGGPVLDGDATVASGEINNASLDETVIFIYDRTILQSALDTAVVKLGDKTLVKDTDYTITSKGNQVMVTLKDLAKSTDYTLTLSGVKDLGEVETAEAATAIFHTAAKDIEAEKPELAGTTLSAKVYSYYAQGEKVKLIAALYNADGTKLVNVAVKEFTVKDRSGETISHDFSDVFNADGKKMGFVWSDFDTMTPYAAAYSD